MKWATYTNKADKMQATAESWHSHALLLFTCLMASLSGLISCEIQWICESMIK